MHQLLVKKLDRRHLIALDVVAALVLLSVVGYAAVDATVPGGLDEPAWLSLLTAALVAGPVAVRRVAPLPALAVSVAAEVAAMVSGVIPMIALGAPLIPLTGVLYLVASAEPRRRSGTALAACLAALAAGVLYERFARTPVEPWSDTVFGLAFAWLALTAGWTVGLMTRERRHYAERTAAQRARQAVADERLRIARELHDVVAHSMSLIAIKAAVGNHVAEQRPAEARAALRVIEETSRASLVEMRQLLGVLRSEVDGAALAPAPSADGIPALVERARSAGVPVSAELPDLAALPDGVGLSVYRIVQEALTNVVRHAASARCWVRVAWTGADVRVEVTNDGPVAERRADGPVDGHGLIGMRERVGVYGGTFEAGPRPEGGWRVSAVLPLGAPA